MATSVLRKMITFRYLAEADQPEVLLRMLLCTTLHLIIAVEVYTYLF